jgi:hypothetical protein
MNFARLYVLSDPRTGELRYVGWTSRTVAKRLTAHLNEANGNGRHHRLNWLGLILAESLRPIIRTIAILETKQEAKRCEVAYISALRGRGHDLVNSTAGGDGLADPTPEVRARMAEAQRGKRHSRESIERGAAKRRGVPRSQEANEKTAAFWRGRHHTPESRARMSAVRYGKKQTTETIAKRVEKTRGLKRSAETILRMSAAQRARHAREKGEAS